MPQRRLILLLGIAALALGCASSHDEETCRYDGRVYEVGQRVPSSDGCNDCTCGAGGQVACTLRACVDSGPALSWYRTCGDPVCGPGSDRPTGQPPCTDQREGAACTEPDERCDPGLGCGTDLICTDRDPTQQPGGCPI